MARELPSEVKPYHTVSAELTVQHGLLLRGSRIVIPRGGRYYNWYLREEERERATHETNSSLSALSCPTDLGSAVGVCVHTGPAGETGVMWPEQHWA